MNRARLSFWGIVTLVVFLWLPTTVQAEVSAAEARLVEQMETRLPQLVKLKLAGKVGENNQALLEPRTVLDRDDRRLVADENRDRMALYRLIAERTGAPLPNVQVERAEDIRDSSPSGVWLQSPKGDWYRELK